MTIKQIIVQEIRNLEQSSVGIFGQQQHGRTNIQEEDVCGNARQCPRTCAAILSCHLIKTVKLPGQKLMQIAVSQLALFRRFHSAHGALQPVSQGRQNHSCGCY